MKIKCVWEHNGNDTLLYAVDLPGAFTRGTNLETAMSKMPAEIQSYLHWIGEPIPEHLEVMVIQDAACGLNICDADSEVLFESEKAPLCQEEYTALKQLALKSAEDFLTLYDAVPDPSKCLVPMRNTFYGQVPGTAEEMYQHTKNVNEYYFGEIEVAADKEGDIWNCRHRAFINLEQHPNYLENPVFEGSYGESWTLRKVMRRFLWHDRIHAKAMYRRAVKVFEDQEIPNVFCFNDV